MGGRRLINLDLESFRGELSASWMFHSMLSSIALPSQIQIPTGKFLWNKVQASYPAAVMGLPDALQTECSQ